MATPDRYEMATENKTSSNYLYDRDYCLWLEETAKLLRDRKLESLDFEHLIEEIDDLWKDKRRELKNRLIVLLIYLLKYQYQPERRSSSWVATIWEQYHQIECLLEDSPSLKPYYLEIFSDCYSKAVRAASTETKLSESAFPTESPFLPGDVINPDFIVVLVNQESV